MPSIDVKGVAISYRLEGAADKPVLMLSHSLGADVSMWDGQVDALGARFRLLRYDGRGHGGSAVPAGDCTIDDLGNDALGLLDALQIERVHFCGLSMGGMVGMWLGLHAGDRLANLVLANTAAAIGAPDIWNARIEAVRRAGMQTVVSGVLERWFSHGFEARSPETVEEARRMVLRTPPDGYAACCAAIRDMDQRARLSSIQARTLVITGRNDVATPPARGAEIAAAVPGSALVQLDTAHLSNLEAPQAFNAAVLGFLAG
jgi:3-oxoadipate enol-lactonase